ncbi:MAG: hypothetical protein LIO94_00015, partial [Clostridiales bacterium]|nr:hypothetical protein [Clostridiales bacterium]
YIGSIEALLGQDEYLEEKVANLKAILDTMESGAAGTLHLENVTGKNEDITFSPSGEVAEETEIDSEGTEGSDGTDTGSDDTSADSDSSGEDTLDSGDAAADDDGSDGTASDDAVSDDTGEEDDSGDEESDVDLMVFNSSGELVYNVHVKDGVVVDSSGNEVPGCSVNEDGYVVDAYMNIIDPATGDLMN